MTKYSDRMCADCGVRMMIMSEEPSPDGDGTMRELKCNTCGFGDWEQFRG